MSATFPTLMGTTAGVSLGAIDAIKAAVALRSSSSSLSVSIGSTVTLTGDGGSADCIASSVPSVDTSNIPAGNSKSGGGPSRSINSSPMMKSRSASCFLQAPNPSAMTESYTKEPP